MHALSGSELPSPGLSTSGGLEWPEVREAIEEIAEAYPHMEIELWEFKPKAG